MLPCRMVSPSTAARAQPSRIKMLLCRDGKHKTGIVMYSCKAPRGGETHDDASETYTAGHVVAGTSTCLH